MAHFEQSNWTSIHSAKHAGPSRITGLLFVDYSEIGHRCSAQVEYVRRDPQCVAGQRSNKPGRPFRHEEDKVLFKIAE